MALRAGSISCAAVGPYALSGRQAAGTPRRRCRQGAALLRGAHRSPYPTAVVARSRRLLDRIGWPELTAATVAGLYAVAAWVLTPKIAEGALTTGAWLPLVALTLGAILV